MLDFQAKVGSQISKSTILGVSVPLMVTLLYFTITSIIVDFSIEFDELSRILVSGVHELSDLHGRRFP